MSGFSWRDWAKRWQICQDSQCASWDSFLLGVIWGCFKYQDYVVLDDRMIDEWSTEINLEGSGCGLSRYWSSTYLERLRKTTKTSAKIADVPPRIQTQHIKLERSMSKDTKFFLSLCYLGIQHISDFLSLSKLTQKSAFQPIIYHYHC
jgi:hypothetical protein